MDIRLIAVVAALVGASSAGARGGEGLRDFWDEALTATRSGADVEPILDYAKVRAGSFSLGVSGSTSIRTDLWNRSLNVPEAATLEFWLSPRAGSELGVTVQEAGGQEVPLTAKAVEESEGWTRYEVAFAGGEVERIDWALDGDERRLDGVIFRSGDQVIGVTDKPLQQRMDEISATRARRVEAALEAGAKTDFSGENRQIFDQMILGRDLGAANARLRELLNVELADLAAKRADLWSLTTNLRLIEFYYELGSRSDRDPAPLELATEALLLEVLWGRTVEKNDLGWASSDTWWMTGSENHDLNAKVSCLVSSRIFMNEPAYRDRLYPDAAHGPGYGYWFHQMMGGVSDYGAISSAPWAAGPGSNAAAHYTAWVAFFKRYVAERGKRGFFLENASSTYQKWTMGFLLTAHAYGGDAELKAQLGQLFDFIWADWAQQQIAGVRGGPKTRHHHTVGGEDAMTGLARFYLGGAGTTNHIYTSMLVDDYSLPEVVVDLALDSLGRGIYSIEMRGIGEEIPDRPRPEGMERTLMIRPVSRLLKYSWVTPWTILGTQMDHPDAVHSHLSSAGRWHGLTVAGRPRARIVPTGGPEEGGKPGAMDLEMMFLTAQHRNVLVGQQARRWSQISPEWYPAKPGLEKDVFMHVGSDWDEVVEEAGWVFLRSGDGYAAVREVSARQEDDGIGPLDLRPDLSVEENPLLVQIDDSPVEWNVDRDGFLLRNQFSPWVIQSGCAKIDGPFADFRSAVRGARMELRMTVVPGFYTFRYLAEGPGAEEIDFPAATPGIPRIGGNPIDYLPASLTESPYVNSKFGTGTVFIQKGNDRLDLDLAK